MQLTKLDNPPQGQLTAEEIKNLWESPMVKQKKDAVNYKLKVGLSQEIIDALDKMTGGQVQATLQQPTVGEIPAADPKTRDLFTSFKGQVADMQLDATVA